MIRVLFLTLKKCQTSLDIEQQGGNGGFFDSMRNRAQNNFNNVNPFRQYWNTKNDRPLTLKSKKLTL